MSPRPDPPRIAEPLTPEERAWAERFTRVGPHDGPPPALDAKILAAAHAAVAGRRSSSARRRWPAYAGVAASLVVAVGLAWQLRPLWQTRPPLSEAASAAAPVPQDEGTLSAEVLAAADPLARDSVANPPSPPAPQPPLAPRRLKAPPPAVMATAAAPAEAPAPPPAPASSHFLDEAVGDEGVPMDAHEAEIASGAGGQAQSRAAAEADSASRISASEQRERAAAASPTAFPEAQTERAAKATAPAPMPSYAPAATAPRQHTVRPEISARKAMPAPAPPGAAQDNTTLDRIEVTGSRIRLPDLPVRDDARLEPAAWLERIRERRDADDLDGARASLALFRKQHPRIRLPSDLLQLDR